jgi:hypothetical protein
MKEKGLPISEVAGMFGVSCSEVSASLLRQRIRTISCTPYSRITREEMASVFLDIKGGDYRSAKSQRTKQM